MFYVTFQPKNTPPPKPNKPPRAQQLDSGQVRNTRAEADALPAGPAKLPESDSLRTQQYGSFAALTVGTEKESTLSNGSLKVVFSNKGGRPVSAQLTGYRTYDAKPLTLFGKESSRFNYALSAQGRLINTEELFFSRVDSGDGQKATFRAQVAPGSYVELAYGFAKDSFTLNHSFRLVGMQSILSASTDYAQLDWDILTPRQEKSVKDELQKTSVFYRQAGQSPSSLSQSKNDSLGQSNVQWVAFQEKFFISALVAEKQFDKATLEITPLIDEEKEPNDPLHVKSMKASLVLPLLHEANESHNMRFVFAPLHYRTLKRYDLSFERMVSLGFPFVRWINTLIIIPLFNWLGSFGLNFGWVILALTFIIKLITSPLLFRSYLSTARMRVLKPEMDEINKKYPDTKDAAKKQQELTSLYKKAGVNPLGGCIPSLLQIPIFFALVAFFPSSIELRQQHLWWAEDLSAYDSILNLPFRIPAYGDHVSLFTLLFTLSSLAYTHYQNQLTGVTGQMKVVSYLMPVVFLGFFNSLPAGLSYYYFVSQLITIGLQVGIRQLVDEGAIRAKIEENRKKAPAVVQPSAFQQRLQKMAMAQEKNRQAQKKR